MKPISGFKRGANFLGAKCMKSRTYMQIHTTTIGSWGRLYEKAPVRIVINSHWEPSLPNAPGKDKIWEEASPTAAAPESEAKLPQ